MEKLMLEALGKERFRKYVNVLEPRGLQKLIFERYKFVMVPTNFEKLRDLDLITLGGESRVTIASTGLVVPDMVETVDPDTRIRFNVPSIRKLQLTTDGKIVKTYRINGCIRLNDILVVKIEQDHSD